MSKDLVTNVMRMFDIMKADKARYEVMWQDIAEYVRYHKQNFTSQDTKGEFVTDKIFDTTGAFALRTMASALTGNVLPNGAKTVKIRPPKDLEGNKEIKEYYEWASNKLAHYMELKEAGLNIAFDEYMLDSGAFGWGGIYMKDDRNDFDTPLKFASWDPVHTYMAQDSFGKIIMVYNEIDMQISDAIQEYGLSKLPKKAKDLAKDGKLSDTIRVLVAIQPTTKLEIGKKGNKNMPIASIHIAVDSKKLLKESGFNESPATMARFYKTSGETYGASPGTDSFPDVKMANAQSESIIRAAEKQLDPPLYIIDDNSLGTDYIDTSAGAVNILAYNGRFPTSDPLKPMFTVGESRSMKETLAETRGKIMEHFLIDRLLDLNNDTRMTAFETSVREKLRGESLSSVYNRQTTEMINPLFKKGLNTLFDRGFLGVFSLDDAKAKKLKREGVEVKLIPEEILIRIRENKDVYELEYTSPSARILKREEITSLLSTLAMINEAINTFPDMRYSIKSHEAVVLHLTNTGGDTKLLRSAEEVKELKAADAAAAAEAQKLENANKGATALRDTAQASQMTKE